MPYEYVLCRCTAFSVSDSVMFIFGVRLCVARSSVVGNAKASNRRASRSIGSLRHDHPFMNEYKAPSIDS